MQRLRSEKAERELQAERKAVDRALRREERTSHARVLAGTGTVIVMSYRRRVCTAMRVTATTREGG